MMAPCPNEPFRTALRGAVESISPVVRQAMDYVRRTSCAAGRDFEIEAALTEALANAVVHGCRGDSNRIVLLSVACSCQKGLQIIVRDDGPGFALSEVENPLNEENIQRSSGRGIFIQESSLTYYLQQALPFC